jgi:hypothetical protein
MSHRGTRRVGGGDLDAVLVVSNFVKADLSQMDIRQLSDLPSPDRVGVRHMV